MEVLGIIRNFRAFAELGDPKLLDPQRLAKLLESFDPTTSRSPAHLKEIETKLIAADGFIHLEVITHTN